GHPPPTSASTATRPHTSPPHLHVSRCTVLNEDREGFYMFSVSDISFTDTYGQRWTRNIDGTLTHGWPELPNRELGDVREFMKWLKGASRKMSALDECGAAT
ncbi:hypothetical protein ACWDUK_30525, partial [Streptomyces cellulosae]